MCAICGKLNLDPEQPGAATVVRAMADAMVHRGPDGEGFHVEGPVALGHRRLSIIDLATGDQPMANEDGTVWIVFNGEIYNFEALRRQLLARGHHFKTSSDTEVILHLYEEKGVACLEDLRGMFAFALWDRGQRRLFLARDRLGIKPLYYYQGATAFWFASEIKALLVDPAVPRTVQLEAIATFLQFHYLPGEQTPLEGIRKLAPGHYLLWEAGRLTERAFWDLKFEPSAQWATLEGAAEGLTALLAETVQLHLLSDVPLGVLLSGGVDSSALLSFAARSTDRKVRTFTVGFEGQRVVDERPFARQAARAFGAEHHELSLSASEFWDFLPAYAWHMEELVCEPPAVALYYVAKLARRHVKVLLSGEGGDEAFGGYPNYPNRLRLRRWETRLGKLAGVVGSLAGLAGRLLGDERLLHYAAALGRPLAASYFSRTSGPSSFFLRQAPAVLSPDFLETVRRTSPAGYMARLLEPMGGQPLLHQMLYADTKTWLPDDLLVKADKMTMATSVELRVPLLDHKVLEFAASLPPEFKVRGSETKRVLKHAFGRVLPAEVLQRRKAGFPVPYAGWLRGELRPRLEEMLLSGSATQRGYFRPGAVEKLLAQNARTGRFSKEVFMLLVLELWQRRFVDAPRAAGASGVSS